MKNALIVAACGLLVVGSRAEAQSATAAPSAVTASDSVRIEIAPELKQALDQLASHLTTLAARVANDPQLRASALRAAQGAVTLTQVLLEQQTDVLQEALRRAAERLERVPIPQTAPERR